MTMTYICNTIFTEHWVCMTTHYQLYIISYDCKTPCLFCSDVTTDEWAFYLLPLDDDIISMELPEFFRDNFLVV